MLAGLRTQNTGGNGVSVLDLTSSGHRAYSLKCQRIGPPTFETLGRVPSSGHPAFLLGGNMNVYLMQGQYYVRIGTGPERLHGPFNSLDEVRLAFPVEFAAAYPGE